MPEITAVASRSGGSPRRSSRLLWSLAIALLAALAAAVIVLATGIRAVRITSGSMSPTIRVGDWTVVTPLDDGQAMARGEIVMFRYPPGSSRHAIKRVVAIPGDNVQFAGNAVSVNGRPVPPRPPVAPTGGPSSGDVTVTAHHVFLLGDNRAASIDSRTFGPVPDTELVGRIRWWAGSTAVESALIAATGALGLAIGLIALRRRWWPTVRPRS